jgi:hypothetical protein
VSGTARASRRRLRAWAGPAAASIAAVSALVVGCFPSGTAPLLDDPDAGASSTDLGGDAGFPKSDVDLGDPFALEGLQPSHGPFSGGTRAILAGRGFTRKLRVFVGGVEVPPANVLASDPTRAAIVVPPGVPGFVDVKIRDDLSAQERVLPKGFFYDAFVVSPDTGATSGGTRVTLTGNGTAWNAVTKVSIGGADCGSILVTSPTSLECTTPPGAPGSKDVVVTTGLDAIQARDAFTYSDSPDGYRGGLSGGAFTGRMHVLAFDSITGQPIAGAKAIAGSSLATAVVGSTGITGVTEIDGLPGAKITITVAAKCHQPMTFVDVPVDTVTAYLDPVLDPSCAEGDPTILNPPGVFGGVVEGQLVFPGGAEFQRAGWSTVPGPTRPTERRAAYVFESARSPNDPFVLPSASQAITPDADGANGYKYSVVVFPGNATVYAVAGLEDRSETPPKFVPYSMGVVRGITVPAQTRVTGVDIAMDVLFDHQVTIAPQPPPPASPGPDRLVSRVAVTLGAGAFALLPRGTRQTSLPPPATIPFIGVPSLDHALAGEAYMLGAAAATGQNLQRPASVVSRVRTTDANTTVTLGGFLGVPVLDQPGAGSWNGTHVQFSGASGPVDLTLVTVTSGSGLVTWTILAPGAATSFDVPDLAAMPGPDPLGLVRGPISTSVYVARIDGFSYGRLRTGQLSSASWNAYAFDSLAGVY